MGERRGGKKKKKKHKNKATYRCKHRLLSIQHDVERHVGPALLALPPFPVLANERAGTWYGYKCMNDTCRFKSTDGHTWNFSLKRLNLNVVQHAVDHGGAIILDASASKVLPDSFSRTIPIWACVLNRIVVRYRNELGRSSIESWDCTCHLPEEIVPQAEQESIRSKIESRVEALYHCRAIVDPEWLVRCLDKPLRPVWITPADKSPSIEENPNYYPIVCLSCSVLTGSDGLCDEFLYSPGAADDEESWSHRLTPQLFWENINTIQDKDEDETDATIQEIVHSAGVLEPRAENCFHWIGELNLAIGTRRAGRPPECWDTFEAILNVTDTEYSDMAVDHSRFYLQLPVREGKRDKSELERWMAVGVAFVLLHLQSNRRILIHCAQGMDRSVAVTMVVVSLFCALRLPLHWKDEVRHLRLDGLVVETVDTAESMYKYQCSGLSCALVDTLIGHDGKARFLNWVRPYLFPDLDGPLANKESLRLALLLIQQDREKADPTRSTMQKINRFFMSDNTHYS